MESEINRIYDWLELDTNTFQRMFSIELKRRFGTESRLFAGMDTASYSNFNIAAYVY